MTNNKQAKTNQPYDAQTLYKLAERASDSLNIASKWRDDAIAEFVAAAFAAGCKNDGQRSIRSYQYKCGRGAMLDFLKRENRHENLSPAECPKSAKRVSLDMPAAGRNGESTLLAETIVDKNILTPDAHLIRKEKKAAVQEALAQLAPDEAEAARRVWMEDQTQNEAADGMKIGRRKLQGLLELAKNKLRKSLAKYEGDYCFCRSENSAPTVKNKRRGKKSSTIYNDSRGGIIYDRIKFANAD